ncbi:hypothetical protein V1477_008732 [Vespula maculifrons]|uniref:Uncharacterized protein n=1 Tax=Vespula maculifrons TaxID=7453 RepID=A0ABD2CDV0_VESMC
MKRIIVFLSKILMLASKQKRNKNQDSEVSLNRVKGYSRVYVRGFKCKAFSRVTAYEVTTYSSIAMTHLFKPKFYRDGTTAIQRHHFYVFDILDVRNTK